MAGGEEEHARGSSGVRGGVRRGARQRALQNCRVQVGVSRTWRGRDIVLARADRGVHPLEAEVRSEWRRPVRRRGRPAREAERRRRRDRERQLRGETAGLEALEQGREQCDRKQGLPSLALSDRQFQGPAEEEGSYPRLT